METLDSLVELQSAAAAAEGRLLILRNVIDWTALPRGSVCSPFLSCLSFKSFFFWGVVLFKCFSNQDLARGLLDVLLCLKLGK